MASKASKPPADPSILRHYLLDRYTALKTQHRSLGRRALLLIAADEFWALDARAWAGVSPNPLEAQSLPWTGDSDELDADEDASPGIVVRTDYGAGSDEAWATFCAALRDAEREFLADQADGPTPTTTPDGDAAMAEQDDDDGSDEEEGDGGELALFAPVSDPRFEGISNLRALRFFFDVDARVAPAPHPNPHRLTALRGLQETYDAQGRTLWVFDARSREDGCARLVSEAGDVATGDSWRARVTHMAELQAGLAARALRIDFGGFDRWDYAERQRNMEEADAGHTAMLPIGG
ncbi:hypothetical protein BC834DRAFT_872150 [Gloeopeniophorella convolvens]|nr:hypothetical protein BC834DRAFT_872150 [Gloeopeniophorella convolvens]